MRILFDSKQPQFKTPFGTLIPGQDCTLHIHVPATVQAKAVECFIFRENGQLAKYSRTVLESIISAESAGNIIVIKTYPGLAQAVAIGIDNMNLPKILGTVAGDDTIISVTKDADYAKDSVRQIHELIRSL